jgi:hypothetical protein
MSSKPVLVGEILDLHYLGNLFIFIFNDSLKMIYSICFICRASLFEIVKGLTYHEQSDIILKKLESNKLMDSAPFCAYEWLQYIHTNVDTSKNVYDNIERTH